MSNRGNHKSPSKDCMCNKCGRTAHSIPGKLHRRCSGQMDQAPKARGESVPSNERGRWE